jgi:hypothetical protein
VGFFCFVLFCFVVFYELCLNFLMLFSKETLPAQIQVTLPLESLNLILPAEPPDILHLGAS